MSWGGEADKLGHTAVAFLGNAVKTPEECGRAAARAHNWGRAAATFLVPGGQRCGATRYLTAAHTLMGPADATAAEIQVLRPNLGSRITSSA